MTGDELKAWLSSHDYSPRELAYDLGVNWTTAYKWMSGEIRLTPLTLLALEPLAADASRAAWRRANRATIADLMAWATEHAYTAGDLSYALDMPEAAVARMLAKAPTEALPRTLVLALRTLAKERRASPPQGMDGGESFRAWLASNRRTQKDVADALGVTLGAVSRWATGNRDVSAMTRLALRTLERKR